MPISSLPPGTAAVHFGAKRSKKLVPRLILGGYAASVALMLGGLGLHVHGTTTIQDSLHTAVEQVKDPYTPITPREKAKDLGTAAVALNKQLVGHPGLAEQETGIDVFEAGASLSLPVMLTDVFVQRAGSRKKAEGKNKNADGEQAEPA